MAGALVLVPRGLARLRHMESEPCAMMRATAYHAADEARRIGLTSGFSAPLFDRRPGDCGRRESDVNQFVAHLDGLSWRHISTPRPTSRTFAVALLGGPPARAIVLSVVPAGCGDLEPVILLVDDPLGAGSGRCVSMTSETLCEFFRLPLLGPVIEHCT